MFIPWSGVLLEKLSGWQLVNKFPALYGTRRFITAFTSARYLFVSWAKSIQSIPPHGTSWRSILVLSFHLRLGLPSGLFPSGFPTKTLYMPQCSHTRYMPRPSNFSRFYNTQVIWWEVQNRLVYAYKNVSDELADSFFRVRTPCLTLRDQDNNLLKPLAFTDQLK